MLEQTKEVAQGDIKSQLFAVVVAVAIAMLTGIVVSARALFLGYWGPVAIVLGLVTIGVMLWVATRAKELWKHGWFKTTAIILFLIAASATAQWFSGIVHDAQEYRNNTPQAVVTVAESPNAALRDTINQQRTEIESLKRQTDGLSRDLTSEREERRKLQAQLDDRKRREIQRQGLSGFISRGTSLRQRCRTDPVPSALEMDFAVWDVEVEAFLKKSFDDTYLTRLHTLPGGFSTIPNVPQSRLGMFRVLDEYIKTLTGFSDALSR